MEKKTGIFLWVQNATGSLADWEAETGRKKKNLPDPHFGRKVAPKTPSSEEYPPQARKIFKGPKTCINPGQPEKRPGKKRRPAEKPLKKRRVVKPGHLTPARRGKGPLQMGYRKWKRKVTGDLSNSRKLTPQHQGQSVIRGQRDL